ncbi:hypothetical protein BDY19DRAFT_562016 [Irpex rosettiformis]|uniref:Uncharacterized protein n=1 Tax=Irpex rosettiformis TaxID=378272 RepID=A0ACB8TQ10_9APHY|nr:hypothetical protein BDY19DRAFT_562016 [Irpex rosettiformis]
MALNLDSPLSLYSIPAVWFTAFYPVTLKTGILRSTAVGYNNIQPRQNVERAKASHTLDQATTDLISRYEGAHLNGMENLPLWFAAILAGHFAGLSHRTLNYFSAAYISTRLLYNYVYVNQKTAAHSWVRSVVYFTGLSMPLTILIKAANRLQS